jgi:hypothetical protein
MKAKTTEKKLKPQELVRCNNADACQNPRRFPCKCQDWHEPKESCHIVSSCNGALVKCTKSGRHRPRIFRSFLKLVYHRKATGGLSAT